MSEETARWSYKKHTKTKKILENSAQNIAYLFLKFKEKGGTLEQYAKALSKVGTSRQIVAAQLWRWIYNENTDIETRCQQWEIQMWLAISDLENVDLEALMFGNIQSMDYMKGFER